MEQNDGLLVDDPRTYMFFATTVSLTTSWAEGYHANVMANEWVMSVSWEPLRVMTIVSQSGFTHELISQSQEFGINLCSMKQAHLASYAGSVSGREVNKLVDSVFEGHTYDGTQIRAPMIKGCVVSAECKVEETVQFGTYTGFIGLAVAKRVNQRERPLIYTRGKYFFLGNQIPKTINTT